MLPETILFGKSYTEKVLKSRTFKHSYIVHDPVIWRLCYSFTFRRELRRVLTKSLMELTRSQSVWQVCGHVNINSPPTHTHRLTAQTPIHTHTHTHRHTQSPGRRVVSRGIRDGEVSLQFSRELELVIELAITTVQWPGCRPR